MAYWDAPRAPTSAALLVRMGAERGVPVDTCLRGTSLRPDHLDDPHKEVSATQELAVIGNLLKALDYPPGLGLEVGARYHLTTYGIWGFALISSPTPRSALDLASRFLSLTFAFCHIRVREREGEMQLVLKGCDVPPALQRFVVERDATAFRTLQREVYGSPVPGSRMSFTYPAPNDIDAITDIIGITPSFNATENVVACDSAVLDTLLPQANAHTAALAQEQCRELLQKRLARTGLAGQVRDALLIRPAGPPTADEVAASLHISGRTMQRKLAEEGTSFRNLMNEVRERLAEELLASGLPVTEVARRLGYAELSSFSQAFRRWKGMSVRTFRTQQGTRRA
ncbi:MULTISPECIES: AraC family transcriptional regulator [unclassified Streptomyces]|uniref:AraC family transcriptional regulator n=1 Tax=unclassified Streptomyces TaxID=2593676 RepID=UPI00336A9ACA